MPNTRALMLSAAILLLPLAGCGGNSESTSSTPQTPPIRPSSLADATPPASRPPNDPTVAEFQGLRSRVPATWVWQPPESAMRAANYVLPAIEEGSQAHLVVFHRIGGGVEMNIERWKTQFRTPDLRPVEPVITEHEVSGMRMTLVELTGEYQQMGHQWFTPGQTFLAAILEAPGGDLQIRLTGDTETVEAHREDFVQFLMNLAPADGAGAPDPAPAGGGGY